jgi:hypothetical protein
LKFEKLRESSKKLLRSKSRHLQEKKIFFNSQLFYWSFEALINWTLSSFNHRSFNELQALTRKIIAAMTTKALTFIIVPELKQL